MEGSLAIIGFWLFMIALVMKKPLMTFIEKSKEVSTNQQVLQRLQQLETVSQSMAKDLSEIRTLIQSQSADGELLKLKETLDVDQDSSAPAVAQSPLLVKQTEGERGLDHLLERSSTSDILGTVEDSTTIRFERVLPAEVEAVWRYLTDPELVCKWLGKSSMQPRDGGRIEINFDSEVQVDGVARIRGLIDRFDAPKSIAYSWIDTQSALPSHVSFELSEHELETNLVLVHSGLPEDKLGEFLALWHTRLDALIAHLKGLVPPDFVSNFRKLLPIYTAVALSMATTVETAEAAVSDQGYQTIRIERSHLLTKYDNHWHDADELEREIVRLKHENTAAADQIIDQLDKKLKDEYRDLRQIELDIRALDKALL
ncbi:MAG: SRPBCC family protein [Candidatus Obscuribacterales bacterium]